jgi:ubiquinone/menaquinone biosynthesis C-methylase UbiE
MNNFDLAANTWDENPVHMDRSLAIAGKMRKILPLTKSMNALEYGAGTGILSILLREDLGNITMMDSSSGMVKVMENKLITINASNLHPVCFNLEQENSSESFDLIFNQMVLHHITDTAAIFEKFYNMLHPGGCLAIADLFPEDGSFHGDGFDGHKGFDPKILKAKLIATGYKDLHAEECYIVRRKQEDNSFSTYPVFLLTAFK